MQCFSGKKASIFAEYQTNLKFGWFEEFIWIMNQTQILSNNEPKWDITVAVIRGICIFDSKLQQSCEKAYLSFQLTETVLFNWGHNLEKKLI